MDRHLLLLLLYSITNTRRNKHHLITAKRTATEFKQTDILQDILLHLWGFLCVRDAGRRVTKSLRDFLGYSKQSEDLWWCLGMLTLNGMMKKYFMQFLMLLNFLFTAARLFYDLMPSRNCNKAQKFGMGFLGGVNFWSRDFCGFC